MTQTLTSLVPITHEQEQAIETRRMTLLDAAESLAISDADTEAEAWSLVNRIGELKKMIVTDFSDSKAAAHAAHKAICDQEKSHLDRLMEPDRIVRGKLSAWADEKDRLLREAQRIQQERENARVAEENRIAREKAEKEAEDLRLAEAAEAENAGDKEKAEELLEAPIEVAPVPEVAPAYIPQMVIPKVAGQGAMVETWHFEIVFEEKVPREYLIVDEKAIRRVVEAMKGRTNIAGVRVWSTQEPRRSGRRPTERYQHHDDPPNV